MFVDGDKCQSGLAKTQWIDLIMLDDNDARTVMVMKKNEGIKAANADI